MEALTFTHGVMDVQTLVLAALLDFYPRPTLGPTAQPLHRGWTAGSPQLASGLKAGHPCRESPGHRCFSSSGLRRPFTFPCPLKPAFFFLFLYLALRLAANFMLVPLPVMLLFLSLSV